jgi:hypothetical protein
MIGTKVTHKQFGVGIVKDIDESEGLIKITFLKNTLAFPYPGAFREFLTAEDPEMQKALTSPKAIASHE